MVQKVRGGNRRVKSGTPGRRRNGKKKDGVHRRLRSVLVPLILVSVVAIGVWQCVDDPVSSPLAPVAENDRKIDVGDGQEADPTLVNESALLEDEHMGKPDAEALAEAVGEPVEDRSIAAAGEELEVDTEAELAAKYPLHAVAYHFHTQIFEKPDTSARVLGYARRGATFRLSERVSKKGCPRGWHEVHGGGFVCDGKGFNVSREPISFEPSPPAAKINEPLPYDYKYVKRDGVAEFWKIPNSEEIAHTAMVFAALEKQPSDATAKDTDEAPLSQSSGESESADDDEATESPEVIEKTAAVASLNPGDAVAGAIGRTASDDGDQADPEGDAISDTDEIDLTEIPPYVHLKMAKGYYVSVNQKISKEGVDWQQTVRGRYIDSSELYPASPSEFEGVLLDRKMSLPVAFVINGGVRKLTRDTTDGPLKNGARVDRYSAFHMLGTIHRNKREYVEVGNGEFIFRRAVGIATATAPPEDIGETERWIAVNLTEQTLVAYEGQTPVFATLISSGREGFETPVGEFRIYNKHVTITMDDPDGGEEAYSIEDVPWTQYFEEGYALHSAFWHDRFGRVRSHGCINLSPADARRLFYWTGPHLNDGMHGVIATADNPGTRIVINN